MTLQDPLYALDDIEAIATEELAARGWKLERKAWASGQFPDGWDYFSMGYGGSGGAPFTVEGLARWVETRADPDTGPDVARDCKRLREIIITVWAAREAIARGDAVAAFSIGSALAFHERLYDYPATLKAGANMAQSARAKKKRRPRLAKRAVMLAMGCGYRTADDVENFLFNERELRDQWGEFDIEPRTEGFIITDLTRDTSGATLQRARITKLISEVRKSR